LVISTIWYLKKRAQNVRIASTGSVTKSRKNVRCNEAMLLVLCCFKGWYVIDMPHEIKKFPGFAGEGNAPFAPWNKWDGGAFPAPPYPAAFIVNAIIN
jgi:hypothetical protein